MSSQPLDVEISVVNTNNRDLLERCLASLPAACEALTAGSDDLRWHVTVIDNASTDGSAAMVAERFPDATVRRNEDRRGFGTNHNQVLRAVVDQQLARYALVLNEDTEVSPGSITALVRRCDTNPGVGAAGPTLVGGDGLPQRTYRPLPRPVRDLLDPLGITRERSPGPGDGYLNGACLLLRTEALRQIGVLDERFFIFYEDADLGRRLWNAGWASVTCPQARVVHHEHRTVSKTHVNASMERQMLRSRYLYLQKHHGTRRAMLAMETTRSLLALRALKARLELALRRSSGGGEAQHARLLLELARYDPRRTLAHEEQAVRENP